MRYQIEIKFTGSQNCYKNGKYMSNLLLRDEKDYETEKIFMGVFRIMRNKSFINTSYGSNFKK